MNQLQTEIISELQVQPDIDPAQEITERVEYLEQYLEHCGRNGFVLGISGGQDSLLAGILAKKAVDRAKLAGHEAAFHAMLLPYGAQTDRDDALLACEFIKPDHIHDWDISTGTDALAETFRQTEGTPISDFEKGNIKARVRMIAQYALAGTYGLLVVGTDHAAEAVTGFFTKYGDGGADVVPLAGLTKGQGKQLLKALGAPEKLYTKQPTADLLDNKPGQTDETELGISYAEIDRYLTGHDIDSEAAAKIEQRFVATRHKRALPVAPTLHT